MAGAELVGKEELLEIQELFHKDKVNLYRYGPNNYKTKQFEAMFSEYMGVKYAHAVSSGTAAIHSALAAMGVSEGDEVITTAWTFVAPIEAIVALGAKPILVNIDETFSLDPNEIKAAITSKTKAIISVPMWAAPKMNEIIKICDENNLILIEDAAQSLGAEFKGKKLGTFGEIGTFSFDAGKTLHVGEGGMIITDDSKLAERAKHLTTTAKIAHPYEFVHDEIGYNYRMPNLNAALGCAQMERLDEFLAIKKQLAEKWDIFFSVREIDFVKAIDGNDANHWLNAIIFDSRLDRDEFLKRTNNNNVMSFLISFFLNFYY